MSESSNKLRPSSYRNRKKPASQLISREEIRRAAGAALAHERWNPERQPGASAAAAALNRMRKARRGGPRAFCECGECLTCYNRERKRESRARLKAAPVS